MKDARTFNIVHAGYKRKAGPSEGQKSETGDWWVRDPMTKLRNYMKENGYRLIDLFRDFDKDSNNTISREEFIIGVEVRQERKRWSECKQNWKARKGRIHLACVDVSVFV